MATRGGGQREGGDGRGEPRVKGAREKEHGGDEGDAERRGTGKEGK